jgi:hypothetical protein
MSIVLRVYGPELDLDACLKWLPRPRVEKTWKVGDAGRRGKAQDTNGLHLLLAEGGDLSQALNDAVRVLSSLKDQIRSLVDAGNTADVEVAVFVYPPVPRTIGFDEAFLLNVIEAGARLEVSAYPRSRDDEEDEDEESASG